VGKNGPREPFFSKFGGLCTATWYNQDMDAKELRTLAKEHAPEALLRAVELMRTSKSDATCLKAAELVLCKAYGKSFEEQVAKVEEVVPLEELSRKDRIEALREALSSEELAMARDHGMIA